ncbi:MAG: OmpA family protein [Rikenellaceae bacterium]|jgi:outer membrane protein OmpA-like peptidoglycan-associated protein|nr:OmpA family protein [Rikenellaceae bacterium]
MKNVRNLTVSALCALMVFTGCSTMNQTQKGTAVGAGGGAALGAGIGALIGGGKGAGIGAAIGTAVGAGTGALIGRRMDKQKAELEQQLANSNVEIETVTDDNDLQAIKVTFPDGILFATGKSDLSAAAISELSKFAVSLAQNPDTDVTINGHTDNTGSRAVNERLSLQRADAVENYLIGQGLNRSRFTANGLAYDVPVADNSTAEGRAKNRRVEIYLTASKAMIAQAQQGTLQ